MPIVLQQGKLEDAAILAAVGGDIFRETYTGKMLADDLSAYIAEAFSIAQIQAELLDTYNNFILAFYDGVLVGYAKLRLTAEVPASLLDVKPLLIDRMYVLQAYHGKKIGAALMLHCLEYAMHEGFEVVWLAVWEKNPAAMDFYKRWGFELFDARFFQRGNDQQTGLLMKKFLLYE